MVWEGFLEKVAFGEGPKEGKRGGERGVSPAGGGEGAAGNTPQVEILGCLKPPRGRNWELLLNLTQTSNKERDKEYTEAKGNGQEGRVINGPESCGLQ